MKKLIHGQTVTYMFLFVFLIFGLSCFLLWEKGRQTDNSTRSSKSTMRTTTSNPSINRSAASIVGSSSQVRSTRHFWSFTPFCESQWVCSRYIVVKETTGFSIAANIQLQEIRSSSENWRHTVTMKRFRPILHRVDGQCYYDIVITVLDWVTPTHRVPPIDFSCVCLRHHNKEARSSFWHPFDQQTCYYWFHLWLCPGNDICTYQERDNPKRKSWPPTFDTRAWFVHRCAKSWQTKRLQQRPTQTARW
jgi:hypothetical protein